MKKNKKTFFILVLIILAILFFCVVLFRAVFYAPPTDEINLPSPTTSSQKSFTAQILINKNKNIIKTYPAIYPKLLRIPSINVNAKIQYVGITRSGKMATPNNFTDVGWFQYGTIPGNKGSAVIAGHVDNGLSFPAVFADLGNMIIGDNIYIDTIGNNTIHFKVTDIKNYDPEANTEEIFNQKSGNFLKLITCAGVWSAQYRTHNQRLVVTAEQVQ